ncbi:hypothetical protein HY439_00905 [Candidatus Microgenomates bacterium]|nr:hypothetical protein [Candidatus Microgenomates bacterium]
MKKKSARNHSPVKKSARRNNAPYLSTFYIRYTIVAGIALLFLFTGLTYSRMQESKVLGTKAYLVDRGEGEDDSRDSNKSGSVTRKESSSSDSRSARSVENDEDDERGGHRGRNDGKIEVKTSDNHAKLELRTANTKIEMENKNGQLKLKVKQEDEDEIEIEDDSLEEINDELEDDDIHIGTTSAGFTVRRGRIEAETHFPLSINLATNALTVTTPAGTKVVTILPDQAVQNLISNNIMNRIRIENPATPSAGATPSASATSSAGIKKIKLIQTGNKLVFEVKGVSDKKFLGILPVEINRTALVQAQTGQVESVSEDLFNRFLDLISF